MKGKDEFLTKECLAKDMGEWVESLGPHSCEVYHSDGLRYKQSTDCSTILHLSLSA
jgi:hypothetical protein